MRGTARIKKSINYIRRRFKRAAVILMYHRVTKLQLDYFQKSVSPGNFIQQLEHIKNTCHPISLTELVYAIQRNSIPKRAVVVTFDDGYADNYYQACPILESAQIPAIFFITTNFIGSVDEFWSDKLAHILFETDHLPEHLDFELKGKSYNFELSSPEEKRITFRTIYDLLIPLPFEYKDKILGVLANWSETSLELRPDCRFLTTEELVSLSRYNLIEIGAHTLTHPLLPVLSEVHQYHEIVGSKYNLETIIDKPVNFFSYPHGAYSEISIEFVEDAGFHCAVTTVQDNVRTNNDIFQLPRFNVGDWDLDIFKNRLDSFFRQ